MMIRPPTIPTLFITGTDTDVGKTVVAGAIADWFRRRGARVGALKPVASGCVQRREGLVSEDAEFLAHCGDVAYPLEVICPNRYAEPLSPNVAAERAGEPVDWDAVQRSIDLMSRDCDILIVEGAGGIMVPIDGQHLMLDAARWLNAPAVVVARPGLGTINHSVLTVVALRSAGVPVAGVVINRYPVDRAGVAEETNLRQIERWTKAPLLAVVPDATIDPSLPSDIVAAVELTDWASLARAGGGPNDLHGRRQG
ncbi:MAG TPA: dethiobiotin synthase [Tepidisphaeraceae bacterium]|jgi:dethiobiotin synthetase|nr:dethiobiotin synthase [Tepidisphaeraceae bacterium]